MPIDRILRLRDYGVFRDFSWPADLADFGRYNLLYGWNGSGKTTLSRLFRALERRSLITAGQATVRIDGNDVGGAAFPQVTVPVRVFNRDFVQESVFPIGGGDVPPIFVIGKDSVDKQKEADRLKGERTATESSLAAARAKKQDADRAFDRFCIDRARVIKDTLRSPGANPYNNYDKAAFQGDAQRMAAENEATVHLLQESDRDVLLAQHRSTPKPKVKEIAYRLPSLQEITDSVTAVLGTTVVSAAIQSLKNDASLAEWTRHGLGLHKDRQSKNCLFCEQPLPEGRLAALEAHFSTEYERLLHTIDEQVRRIQESVKDANQLRLPNRAELYEDLASDYDAAQLSLTQALSAFQELVDGLVKALNAKKGQPFTAQKADVSLPAISADVVERLNAVIRKHNQACDDFQSRVSAARKRLALDMIARDQGDWLKLRDAVTGATSAIQPLADGADGLSRDIQRLEREIVEHRQPAEELNEDLRKYLGHGELQLAIKDTGYSITRNGETAQMLSEGEMTAIALLYFLKSLEDRGFDKANGVVVLDDPVSSLDANALYAAFGFIRERAQSAAQVIILTHSFAFFRQVRNWFHHMKGQNKKDVALRPARFYMLNCACLQEGRCAVISWLDPLLEKYESEYHYLFAHIYRATKGKNQPDLERNYVLPNLARRLLEAFLAFRHPGLSGEMWQKLQLVKFDEAKKIRIIRFLHTHSHNDTFGEPEHDLSLMCEAHAILEDMLALMKSEDEKHFSAMEALIAEPVLEDE